MKFVCLKIIVVVGDGGEDSIGLHRLYEGKDVKLQLSQCKAWTIFSFFSRKKNLF